MAFVDGVVIAVPTSNRDAYKDMATRMAQVFKEFGATRVVECWGADVPDGKLTSFPLAVQAKPEESIVFSWIEWPSREVRDAGMAKVMADPRMQPEGGMPFDGKRMIFGGFSVLVEA